jgi:CDP-glucose 4,6-dehydratase
MELRQGTLEGLVTQAEAMKADSFSWENRRVFLTGHTGFKGGWLALWLAKLGANVRGYALDPCTEPNLFTVANVGSVIEDIRGDIRNAGALQAAMQEFAPEVVFHLAAQPLVRHSYEDPISTYETNVIGTAKVLDIVRRTPSVRAVVSVTTDKCYENKEWVWPYRETDPLGGYDPYSSSKACAEIVSAAFRQSYFPVEELGKSHQVAVATARAGNVIGGGDWSIDRLLPDLVRGFLSGKPVLIRRPYAIRPWQHVLEPLHGYIRLAERLLTHDPKFATAYNFGPIEDDARPVHWIAERMSQSWGDGASWVLDEVEGPHEASYLKLDASRASADLGWTPLLRLDTALDYLVRWYRQWDKQADMHALTLSQIENYSLLISQTKPIETTSLGSRRMTAFL